MPALVNISVGSLRGTSGDDGTISWPLSAKNLRNVDLISLTPLMSIQSQKLSAICRKTGFCPAPLLDKGDRGVQKVCSRSGACRAAVDSCCSCVDSLGAVVFSSYLLKDSRVGRDRLKCRRRRSNRPGNSQANGPRDLLASGKRRRRPSARTRPPTG